jgi:hypothetical protein
MGAPHLSGQLHHQAQLGFLGRGRDGIALIDAGESALRARRQPAVSSPRSILPAAKRRRKSISPAGRRRLPICPARNGAVMTSIAIAAMLRQCELLRKERLVIFMVCLIRKDIKPFSSQLEHLGSASQPRAVPQKRSEYKPHGT